MIKEPLEVLRGLEKTHLCYEHGTPVHIVWNAKEDCHTLLCTKGEFPEMVTREPTLTEMHQQGEELPEPIKGKVEKSIARRAQSRPGQPTATTFSGIPAVDLGSGELIGAEMVRFLVDYARGYKLDPQRSHVVLMYGKPYITLDGYLFYANQSGRLFTMASRPLDAKEKVDYQVEEGDHAWLCELRFEGAGNYLTGLGIVTRAEMDAKSPRDATRLRSPVVAAHPWQLAQKRAEWQALRRAFPIGGAGKGEEE